VSNRKGSARSKASAKTIQFSDRLTNAIRNKVRQHNSKHPMNMVHINTAKAVVRRGMGAYSTSHRPGTTRQQWGLARLEAFFKKKIGKGNPKYTQDNDLL
jgi:hypothetical protein